MATNYKTPGVYIEEIVKFPPSVAQVETAIPAFIGYTEKATKKTAGDLINDPTRITSLLDYENYFGSAYPEKTISVNITDVEIGGKLQRDIVVNQPSSPSTFLMYYALQMYFANGGGPCYIVSVNTYEDENSNLNLISFSDLKDGLDLLRSEDEPTLILFPDATGLASDNDFYELYKSALTQCHDMQDRFAIIDTYRDVEYENDDTDLVSPIDEIRLKLNQEKDYLKYGAVYFPYLKTILDYKYDENSILINHISYKKDAVPIALGELNDASNALTPIISALRTISDSADADATNDNIVGAIPSILKYTQDPAGYNNNNPDFTVAKTIPAFTTLLDALIVQLNNLVEIKKKVKNAANSAIASVEELSTADDNIIVALAAFTGGFEGANKIESVLKNIIDLTAKIKNADTNAKVLSLVKTNATNIITEVKKLLNYTPVLGLPDNTLAITPDVFLNMSAQVGAIIAAVSTVNVSGVDVNNGAMNGRFLADIEPLENASYNIIKSEIAGLPVTLPPSSALAGVYARVDSDRGVWKAPANVGLNYVIKPSLKITNGDQDNLNVDTTAGKSINAIRSFTGKGTLVWGSRTLAGNDSEWRYIPVRRFFNMAEESIKKATEQFVFEPNDANTWIRVRAMIENFLILQWRAGALAGAKPEQAFYVRVGLGQTMSAIDILDGNMIIEIGMAVVRPAEFIILRFSHKMQES
ncbi:phage tail sheath C-terminal domain-containing protein [Flavobacterium sp. HTF]|uniref:phage tail sheath C-terminal domain-containing protein n=1 Tax=Flavobacterium sp. HTF TaxID=2170732 RepID=UPI000D5EFFFB|nr:phage tail sheath C-terminal domain-containing protein [Flavobacterium sp. HTF]PWB25002.1 phage tail protein [Flavobacterium sp. HTF]